MPFNIFPYGYFYRLRDYKWKGLFDTSFLYDSDLFQLVDADGFDLDAAVM